VSKRILEDAIGELRAGTGRAPFADGKCVAGFGVLRDEGEAYARKLWEAGVRVTCTRYIGTIHDFVMLNAITDAPAARGAIAQANAALISCAQ
jgi:acetyl esterase/lipase